MLSLKSDNGVIFKEHFVYFLLEENMFYYIFCDSKLARNEFGFGFSSAFKKWLLTFSRPLSHPHPLPGGIC